MVQLTTSAAVALLLLVPSLAAPLRYTDEESGHSSGHRSHRGGADFSSIERHHESHGGEGFSHGHNHGHAHGHGGSERYSSRDLTPYPIVESRSLSAFESIPDLSQRDLELLNDLSARDPFFGSLLRKIAGKVIKKFVPKNKLGKAGRFVNAFLGERDLSAYEDVGELVRREFEGREMMELLEREPGVKHVLKKIGKFLKHHHKDSKATSSSATPPAPATEAAPTTTTDASPAVADQDPATVAARELDFDLEDLMAREPGLKEIFAKIGNFFHPHHKKTKPATDSTTAAATSTSAAPPAATDASAAAAGAAPVDPSATAPPSTRDYDEYEELSLRDAFSMLSERDLEILVDLAARDPSFGSFFKKIGHGFKKVGKSLKKAFSAENMEKAGEIGLQVAGMALREDEGEGYIFARDYYSGMEVDELD